MATDSFMNSGGAALSFPNVGDKHTIIVRKVVEQPDTEPNGTVKTWPDGSVKNVFVFHGENPDGEPVCLYVRSNMVKAVREAMVKAGLTTVVDTKLQVAHTGLGEARKGMNPAKLYVAKVEKVAAAPVADGFTVPASGGDQDTYDPFADE